MSFPEKSLKTEMISQSLPINFSEQIDLKDLAECENRNLSTFSSSNIDDYNIRLSHLSSIKVPNEHDGSRFFHRFFNKFILFSNKCLILLKI